MKRTRLLLIFAFVMLIGSAFTGHIVVAQTSDNTETPATDDVVEVVVAVQTIPRGTTIGPEMVNTVQYPGDLVSPNMFSNVEDVIGLYARTEIVDEQVLFSQHVSVDPTNNDGSDLARFTEESDVAMTLRLPHEQLVMAFAAGDRVDIIYTVSLVETASPEDTPTRMISFIAVTDADVLAIAPDPTNDALTALTLGVLPQQAVELTHALKNNVYLTVVLRSASSRGFPPTNSMTLDDILEQYGITPPEAPEFIPVPLERSPLP